MTDSIAPLAIATEVLGAAFSAAAETADGVTSGVKNLEQLGSLAGEIESTTNTLLNSSATLTGEGPFWASNPALPHSNPNVMCISCIPADKNGIVLIERSPIQDVDMTGTATSIRWSLSGSRDTPQNGWLNLVSREGKISGVYAGTTEASIVEPHPEYSFSLTPPEIESVLKILTESTPDQITTENAANILFSRNRLLRAARNFSDGERGGKPDAKVSDQELDNAIVDYARAKGLMPEEEVEEEKHTTTQLDDNEDKEKRRRDQMAREALYQRLFRTHG